MEQYYLFEESILVIILASWIIWRASEGFEEASIYLGKKYKLKAGVRGATINAIASSMPEFFTTIFFLFWNDKSRAAENFGGGLGTTAGSALFNSVIIPSLVLIFVFLVKNIRKIELSRSVILRDGVTLIIAETVLISFLFLDELTYWNGLILILIYVGYLFYMFRFSEEIHKQEEIEEENINERKSFLSSLISWDLTPIFKKAGKLGLWRAWSLLFLTMVIVGTACLGLVWGCTNIAESLNLPIYFIAVIIAAAATSIPDTVISIRDGLAGEYDDAVSNALGSNIFDICFALGLPLLIYTLYVGEPITLTEGIQEDTKLLRLFLLGSTVVVFLTLLAGKNFTFLKAIFLLLIYLAFVILISLQAMSIL